jgi:geranylgeranyl diphosphate synthase type II
MTMQKVFLFLHCEDTSKHYSMQNLHQFQDLFEQYMQNHQFRNPPVELYEPVNYILSLGGKRLRPLMVLAGHSLFDEEVEQSLPAAYAVELFHNFTLLHDDIMDAAPLRRGKPTVHVKYNANIGILSGDVMFALAYDYLLRLRCEQLPDVLAVFTQTAIEICEGQQMDMNFEQQQNVSISDYIRMIELKTAVLLGAALKMGALSAGAPLKEASRLHEFGRSLGIAFQLQDDVLDTYGDPAKFGKKTGGDIAQNKKTYLFLKAMELADERTAIELRGYYSGTGVSEEEKIGAVTGIFDRLGVRKAAGQLMQEYQQGALDVLEAVPVAPQKKAILANFAEALLRREY